MIQEDTNAALKHAQKKNTIQHLRLNLFIHLRSPPCQYISTIVDILTHSHPHSSCR